MIHAPMEALDAVLIDRGLGWVEAPPPDVYPIRVLASLEDALDAIAAAGFVVVADLPDADGRWHTLRVQAQPAREGEEADEEE